MRNTVVYETSYATLIGCTISNNHSPLKYLLSNRNNACIPVLAAFDRGATYTLYNRRARAAASQSRQSAQTRRQRALYVVSQCQLSIRRAFDIRKMRDNYPGSPVIIWYCKDYRCNKSYFYIAFASVMVLLLIGMSVVHGVSLKHRMIPLIPENYP